MVSQSDTIRFLCENGVDVTRYNYNLINDFIAIADKVAEQEYKRVLLVLCEAELKEGAE